MSYFLFWGSTASSSITGPKAYGMDCFAIVTFKAEVRWFAPRQAGEKGRHGYLLDRLRPAREGPTKKR